jgi:hypothetical protein
MPLKLMVRGATRQTSMVDLLDRILDKGIVVDVWARVFLAGVDFGIRVEARMVVASIKTCLEYAGPIGLLDSAAWPQPPSLKEKTSGLPGETGRSIRKTRRRAR